MICNNCKNEISDNSAFCQYCGMLFVVPAPDEKATVIHRQNLPVYNSETFRKKLEEENAQAADAHNNTMIRKDDQAVGGTSDKNRYEAEFDQLDEMYKKALQLERAQKLAEMRKAAEERAREADALARRKAEEELRKRMEEHERHSRAVAEELVKENVISEKELNETDEDIDLMSGGEERDAERENISSAEPASDISEGDAQEVSEETGTDEVSDGAPAHASEAGQDDDDYIFGDEEESTESEEAENVEESESEPDEVTAEEEPDETEAEAEDADATEEVPETKDAESEEAASEEVSETKDAESEETDSEEDSEAEIENEASEENSEAESENEDIAEEEIEPETEEKPAEEEKEETVPEAEESEVTEEVPESKDAKSEETDSEEDSEAEMENEASEENSEAESGAEESEVTEEVSETKDAESEETDSEEESEAETEDITEEETKPETAPIDMSSDAASDEAELAEMLAVIEAEEKSDEVAVDTAETVDSEDSTEAVEESGIEADIAETAAEVVDDFDPESENTESEDTVPSQTRAEIMIKQKKSEEDAESEYIESLLNSDKMSNDSAADDGKRSAMRIPVIAASVLVVAAVSVAGYTAWNNTPSRQAERTQSIAESAYAAKDYSTAEESYIKLLSYGTQSRDVYLHLADTYYNESEHEKAIDVIKEALAAYPDDAELTATLDRLCPVVAITPAGGTFGEAVTVSLSVNGANDIYYILTADDAAGEEVKYEAPITLDANGTYKIEAYGVASDGYKGSVISETYTVNIEPETVPETEAPQETETQSESSEFSFASEYAEYPDTLVEIQTGDRQNMGDYSVFPAKVYHSHNSDKPEGDAKDVTIKISNSAWLHYIDYDYGSIPVKDAYVFLKYIGLLNATTDENGVVTKFDFILGSQK
ncbi:tetratricopeptide repeat protein [Oribacterium sp. P6A1]|uniref:tetratricopeptide repeat protein n=1 Tax=Oribacterium sp. P6A1 TaxID=1410612 RepID=UPI00068C339F|nr:tetratricopeptide repeat protein [Oribacterium sp. P6A1]